MSGNGGNGICGIDGKDKLGIEIPKDGIGRLTDGKGGNGGIATPDGLLKSTFKFPPIFKPLKLIFGIPGIFGMFGGSIFGSLGNSGNSGTDKLGRLGPKDGIGKLIDGSEGRGGTLKPIDFMPGIFGKFGIWISGSLGNSGNSGRLKDGKESPKGGMGNSGMGILKDFSETS